MSNKINKSNIRFIQYISRNKWNDIFIQRKIKIKKYSKKKKIIKRLKMYKTLKLLKKIEQEQYKSKK